MEVVYKLAPLSDPPLHFPLGKDSVSVIRTKAAAIVTPIREGYRQV